jgi:hypothetical protein
MLLYGPKALKIRTLNKILHHQTTATQHRRH